MPVITISRQLGSLGTEITQLLSKDFNCQYLDKESLEEAFVEYGIPRESMERFDEKKPGFWDLFKTDKARYLHFMKEAIFEFVRKGNGIILGRGGQVLLADLPGVLRVRTIAPMEIRQQRVMKRLQCDKNHAVKLIQHSDHERAGFLRFFFGENWEEPSLYDLVINTGSFSAETAALSIKNIIDSDEFKASEKETRQKLEDLCLEHEIKTAIIYKDKILVQFLEVNSLQAVVTLRGIVDSNDDLERCEKVVMKIPGIKEVHNEIYYSPITSAYGIHY
ncbi:MAG: BON domain-containing protein [Candidatus Aminicenantes bacterium]|nr:BON domain-containing protein [Candidatus Aminicenantes bacterium]NIM78992.1 BON domain-containing protein [Candidatus Aminicenantes bacterium]NIN18250.1 BON domain-containing protein [Candidatus Aminicenantes bacterium]NIN42147.1 BON domain-containing protein [Candidatus Aminicenantes bacterium]NIN84903.1 BON domain-containing protein [Candidatus Aminicenantes bacterium]